MYALSPESKSSTYLFEHVSSATLLAPAIFFSDLQSEQLLKLAKNEVVWNFLFKSKIIEIVSQDLWVKEGYQKLGSSKLQNLFDNFCKANIQMCKDGIKNDLFVDYNSLDDLNLTSLERAKVFVAHY